MATKEMEQIANVSTMLCYCHSFANNNYTYVAGMSQAIDVHWYVFLKYQNLCFDCRGLGIFDSIRSSELSWDI